MRTTILLLVLSCGAASAASPKMPTFFARRDYAGLFTQHVAAADTNGDGVADLIANNGGAIEVLLGNGNGTFRQGPTTTTAMRAASTFVAIDINGDGKVDLVLAGGLNGTGVPQGIGVCLGNGDGTFQSVVFYQAGTDMEIYNVVLGDFNGDGILDAAVAGQSGIWLFTGKGGGAFNQGVVAVSLPTGAGALAAADFNGDGKVDLVVTMPLAGTNGSGNGFAVLLGNGDGTFQSPVTFAQPKKPATVAAGILTKGGYPGIAVSSLGSANVALYFGNGAGGLSGPHYVNLPGATSIAIGDVNGDGIPDLVSPGVYIALGNGDGTFKKPGFYPIQGSLGTFNVVLADLRNRGLTDIVTDSELAISVLLSLGKGKYEDGKWTKITGGAGCGAAADYNGDGKPDLAVNNGQAVSILLGTGNASSPFTAGATMPLSGAGCLVTGDLNGDGIPDLLVPTPTAVVAYLGNGDGTFTQKSSTPTAVEGYLALADFNHDGKLDFATSANLIALGNGDGTFQTPTAITPSPPLGGTFSYIAAGDLNRDGWSDLVLTETFTSTNIYVLLNNQQGGFNQSVLTAYGVFQILLADLNRDGNLDALFSVSGGGAYVYLGDGKGGLTYKETLVGAAAPGPVMVADVDGDAIPDIGVMGGDTLAIFLGNGDGTFQVPFYIGGGPSPGDVLVENLHGQLPSAGLPDIVAPDTSGGVMVLINTTK
jgi:VCBS repeat protein/FG-GAP repeat protein